jgi:hypothetical protein
VKARLDPQDVKNLLLEKSASLDWAHAGADVAPLLLDARQIEIMTPQIAQQAIHRMACEP